MKTYRIYAYTAEGDKKKLMDEWIDFMCQIDLVMVEDTDSADDMIAAMQGREAIVYIKQIQPESPEIENPFSSASLNNRDVHDLMPLFIPADWREQAKVLHSRQKQQSGKLIMRNGKYLYH